MSDLFVAHPINHQPNPKLNKSYTKVQSEFLSHHFGHYSIRFIQMIAKDAISKVEKIQVLSIDKLLREIARKFLLTDLELVYLGHAADILEWNIKDEFLKQNCEILKFQADYMHPQTLKLWFLLNLIAWFIKKYIGKLQECSVINAILQQETQGHWESLYQQWLGNCPNELFRLSPRSINLRYTRYSEHCQDVSSAKNYNKMVDQIMELSTSYAMMAGQNKDNKKKKEQYIHQQSQPFMFGRKMVKRDSIGLSNQGNVSKMFDFNNNHSSFQQSNSFLEPQSSSKPKKQIRLGFKGSQQSKINQHVTDLYNNASDLSVSNRRYNPQSTIGVIMNSNVNFFDSKIFSSGQDIIPYTLRSNSGIFKSKLFQ